MLFLNKSFSFAYVAQSVSGWIKTELENLFNSLAHGLMQRFGVFLLQLKG